MKYIFYIALLSSLPAIGQTSLYDLKVRTAYGGESNFQEYKGHKILVGVVNAEILRKRKAFALWDSLKTANPEVVFILVPAKDLDSVETDSAAIDEVKSSATKGLILSDAAPVKKDKKERQQRLVQWLTNASQNEHFDGDIQSDIQIYVISESGVLYAVMERGVRMSVLNEVLKADDVKPSPLGRLTR